MSDERADALRDRMCQLLSATGACGMEAVARIAKEALEHDNELLDKQHRWKVDASTSWPFCEVCGLVRRADGKNKPCKGPTKMRTMEQPS